MVLTAIIHKEEEWFVAECPEIGTASQGKCVEEALANLQEATEVYLGGVPAAAHHAPYPDHLRGHGTCLSCREYPVGRPYASSNVWASARSDRKAAM